MARAAFPGPVPAEVVSYIRDKDLRPGFHHQDVWGAEHAGAFTITKMMKLDLLGDVQTSLAENAAQGQTLRDWSKRIRPELEKRGWWGVKTMTDPLTGEIKKVQLGSARRLKTIYDSNMRAARASGQWQRIQRNKATHPYLLYQLGPSVHHRPAHVALEGTLLPVDDPTVDEISPPQGYGCKCWWSSQSRAGAEDLKQNGYQDPAAPWEINPETGRRTGRRITQSKPVSTERPQFKYQTFINKRTGAAQRVPAFIVKNGQQIPTNIHPAWAGNVGKMRAAWLNRALGDKLDAADAQLAHNAVRTVAASPILDEFIAEARGGATPAAELGELPIGFVSPALKARLGADTQLVRLTPAALDADPGLTRERLTILDGLLGQGTPSAGAAGETIVTGLAAGRRWQAVLRAAGKRIELVSLKPATGE